MKAVYISGSPRKKSNTDYLLKIVQSAGGKFFKLSDHRVEPCKSCWNCRKKGECSINDDMRGIIIPELLKSDVIVLGSPVYFNNVSAQLKAFMDRTWCIKGELRNKIGGAVVVGRRHTDAINAINAFFLKHDMIVANRGVCGFAFKEGEIQKDKEAIESAEKLRERIKEIFENVKMR